jgi:hypothetical protein
MKERISRSVIVIVLVGVAISGLIVWNGLMRAPTESPAESSAPVDAHESEGRASASAAKEEAVSTNLVPALAAGVRSNDSPSLESTNGTPQKYVDVWVQTSEGYSLPNATVKVQSRPGSNKLAISDKSGMARIGYPPENLSKLSITVSHEDFASRKMVWDITAGDVVPLSYQIKLRAGVTVGGIVVDESNAPIMDARLSFHRFWSGGENMNVKGEQPDFQTGTTTSDTQGAWRMKNLPRELLDHINFDINHPDFLGTNLTVGVSGAVEKALRAGTLKIVLHRGLEVRGLVTDENSKPIEGATVWVGRQYFRDRRQTNSDSAGRFAFQSIAEGDTPFSAMAIGRKPVSKTFHVSTGMHEVVLKLEPGAIIKGVVQNQAGEPIPDVRVSLENHPPNESAYEFSTTTGADGRFVWDSAPDEPMQFYIGKSGYAQKRGVALKPNEENVVTLRNPRQIQGHVLDADSGQPVTKFRASAGRFFDPERFFADYPGTKEIADANGQFTLSLDEEQQNGIRVEADDYADRIQSVPADQEGVIKMEFRLKPSLALHGTVVGPDGAPLPGVQVALTKEGFGAPNSVYWRGGKFEKQGGSAQLVMTDADGKFALNSPPESGGLVVALGEIGFGSSTVEQVRESGILMLQPFGQIEGVLKIAGQPAPGREILFSLQNLGVMTDFQKFKVETDDDGKFKFEKIPPGEGQLVRLIKTTPNSWMHSHNTTVRVEPGQTTFVNLGDSGAVIRGRARLDTPPAEGEPMTIGGSLNTAMNRPPFASSSDAQAFYQTPEWRAQMKLQKHFAIVVNADGTFMVDSVPPGSYSLTLSASPAGSHAYGPRPGMPATTRPINVTVPDNPDPMAPIDVGEIVLSTPTKEPR